MHQRLGAPAEHRLDGVELGSKRLGHLMAEAALRGTHDVEAVTADVPKPIDRDEIPHDVDVSPGHDRDWTGRRKTPQEVPDGSR